jgi:acetolactate synthase I/II/III large subunit
LSNAERPVVIAGGSGWNTESCANLQRFAETQCVPVGCAFRFQDVFDNAHPQYAGDVGIGINPKLAERIRRADLLLVIGPRLGEMTTSGYSLIDAPVPKQTLVHIHAGAEELGRVYQADLMINATVASAAAALAALPRVTRAEVNVSAREANADYQTWQQRKDIPGAVQMWEVMQHLTATAPPNAIFTNGAGNYATWVHRFHRYRGFRTQLAPTSGAMGYGVPAAIAAKAVHADRVAIAFAGDGCFLMTGQELATAVHEKLNVIFIVVNNNMYGTIRMHQEREFPGHVHGTALTNPDFAAYARAFGAHGELVEKTADFAPAFARALAAGKPALIEIRIDPEAITPNTTLNAIRESASKK